jgi:hypothetical protein
VVSYSLYWSLILSLYQSLSLPLFLCPTVCLSPSAIFSHLFCLFLSLSLSVCVYASLSLSLVDLCPSSCKCFLFIPSFLILSLYLSPLSSLLLKVSLTLSSCLLPFLIRIFNTFGSSKNVCGNSIMTLGQYHKTFYGRNLRIFVINLSVCRQTFPTYSTVCKKGLGLTLEWST